LALAPPSQEGCRLGTYAFLQSHRTCQSQRDCASSPGLRERATLRRHRSWSPNPNGVTHISPGSKRGRGISHVVARPLDKFCDGRYYESESLMNPNRSRRSILVLVIVALGIVQGGAAPSEPEALGHPLSYWLEHYLPGSQAREREAAATAIRQIGTNGLPAMLVWLRYEPSQTKTEIMGFLKRMRASAYGRWIPPSLTYDHGVPPAHVGFNVLGPAAAPAIPELEQIANDARNPRPAARALMALSAIGPAALPAVEARLANTNFPLPPYAAINMYVRTRTSTILAFRRRDKMRTSGLTLFRQNANFRSDPFGCFL
jgi:hypothetical protein